MRLYLSSYKFGDSPELMVPLIKGSKKTAIIMNAQDNVLPERRAERLQQEIDGLATLGLHPEELDLRDYFGKQEELAVSVRDIDYFWVRGGNVFMLRRAFRQSGFDTIISELLLSDSVAYGGFSAGVCVLAPTLRGVELVDPKDEVLATGYEKKVIWEGLGLLKYSVAPHYRSDHPESADIDRCVAYFETNNMPYRTLRDGEVIIVNGGNERLVK